MLTLRPLVDSLEPRRLLAALESGTSINRLIRLGETDLHTIEVAAGAPLLVSLAAYGEFQPHLRVVAPDGSTLFNQTDAGGTATVVPTPATGTYTVEVTATEIGSLSGNGGYGLVAFRPTSNLAESEFTAADSGRRYTNAISTAGDVDFFTLDVEAGDSVVTIATETAPSAMNPQVALIGPDGEIVSIGSAGVGQAGFDRARIDGRYYVVVADLGNNDTGAYGFTIARVPGAPYAGEADSAAPRAPGVTRALDLPAGDIDVIEIPNVVPGDKLDLTFASTSQIEAKFFLYDPEGKRLAGRETLTSQSQQLFKTATKTGSYWAIAFDESYDEAGTGNFSYTKTAAAPGDGIFTFEGSNTDDVFTVEENEDFITVSLNNISATEYERDAIKSLAIRGNGGDDLIDMTGATIPLYLSGGGGDDTIIGGAGDDTIISGAGRNKLFGRNGDDRLNGSGGRDLLYGEAGNDRLYGQGGNDYIDGGGNNDQIHGGDGQDSLEGGGSNDRIYAGRGDDTLVGGKGDDYLNGEDGLDLVRIKEAGDLLISIESQA